jgi:hydrogenase maturation protease
MTLVLCLGNNMLHDDGVGWAVASALEDCVADGAVVRRSALSGFYLLDELTGWERAIVVDAVQTGRHPPGTVLSFPFEALGTDAGPSPHAVGLPSVVRLGRQSGVPLPARIHIVAIEVADMETFAEDLTPAVRAAVPEAVGVITSLLAQVPVPGSASA